MNFSIGAIDAWLRNLGKPQRQVPEVNLIPEEYLGNRFIQQNRGMLMLSVLVLGILVLQYMSHGSNSLDRLQEILNRTEESSGPIVRPDPLQNQIDAAKTVRDSLTLARNVIDSRRTSWPQLLELIYNEAPAGVIVNAFRPLSETEITITGGALSHNGVTDYRGVLASSELVTAVEIQSENVADGGGDARNFILKLTLLPGVSPE